MVMVGVLQPKVILFYDVHLVMDLLHQLLPSRLFLEKIKKIRISSEKSTFVHKEQVKQCNGLDNVQDLQSYPTPIFGH